MNETVNMPLFDTATTTTTAIPLLSSWGELIEIILTGILFGIPAVIALYRFVFVKPNLKLTALAPIKYQVRNVKWLNSHGVWEELGSKNVFFTYLKLENNGRAPAEDCMVYFTTPEEEGKFVFPQELPLVYTSIVGHGFDIKAGMRTDYEILVDGTPIHFETSQTISKSGGKSTLLLLFNVEGFKQSIVGLARGSAGLPIEPRTIVLRTSFDGKLHSVKLEPAADGSYVATVLD